MLRLLIRCLFLLAAGYYPIGGSLLYFGVIQKLPVFYHTALTRNDPGQDDPSTASPDGPYVFYRGSCLVVRSITCLDSACFAQSDTFTGKKDLHLSCPADSPAGSFSFSLADSLSVQADEYLLPSRMLVISDIEGNFPAFRAILQGSGVIDRSYNWTFGKGHLVLPGDFFDRGLYVTQTLWLIYKLEQEAERAGGKVHFILGNHDIMNLYGDDRYVRKKYKENAALLKESYRDLYSAHTELGRWLRTKNVAEKIGDILFVHGGISPKLAESGMSLRKMNEVARENLGKSPHFLASPEARLVYDNDHGPFWYRGLVKGEATMTEVNQILDTFKARRMVVGHTLVKEISSLYGGKVIAIDLHHASNFEKGIVQALWIEGRQFYVIDNKGQKKRLR